METNEQYKISDYHDQVFKIGRANRKRWYIVTGNNKKSYWVFGLYLHKDKTLHDLCGPKNFFNSYDDAYLFLKDFALLHNCVVIPVGKELFLLHQRNINFITEEEMLL